MTRPLIAPTSRRLKRFVSNTNRIPGAISAPLLQQRPKINSNKPFCYANCLAKYKIIPIEAPPGPAQGRQTMSRHNAWRLVVAIFVLSLSGCSVANKRNASISRDDYQACLAANPDNVQACEDKRLIMERDQREYERRCQFLPCF